MAVIPLNNYKLARAMKGVDRLFPSIQDMRREAGARIEHGSLNAATAQRLLRHVELRCKEAVIFNETRKELLATCQSDEQREELLAGYLRVPQDDINALRKLEHQQRVPRLLELIERYQSGNGGHDKNHLDRTTYGYNPHHFNQKKDHLGHKARPWFIYDAIDRLLFAVLFPERFKSVFFHKTSYKVDRWGDWVRQIRSEGRESMVKVLIVLLLNFNPRRMLSGRLDKGEWVGIRVTKVAEYAGLSVSRVKTALRNLEDLQILWKGKQKREKDKDTGEYRGFAVIRSFKYTLFVGLGLGKKLATARVMRPGGEIASEASVHSPEKKPAKEAVECRSADDVLAMGLLDD